MPSVRNLKESHGRPLGTSQTNEVSARALGRRYTHLSLTTAMVDMAHLATTRTLPLINIPFHVGDMLAVLE